MSEAAVRVRLENSTEDDRKIISKTYIFPERRAEEVRQT